MSPILLGFLHIVIIVGTPIALAVFVILAKKVSAKYGLELNQQELNLLQQAVGEAVAHTEQMADNVMMNDTLIPLSSNDKKTMAISVATKLADNLGVSAKSQTLIGDLIESHLGKQNALDT